MKQELLGPASRGKARVEGGAAGSGNEGDAGGEVPREKA